MSWVTVTTTPRVTVVCFGASSITIAVTMAPTTVGLALLGQLDILLPPLILGDTLRGSVGLATAAATS